MGDSTCLMQPFCYASGISNETNESNQIHALGQSISFGRFMSESLAWEKWSTFSHNRYVEEAERFSRPGSVAQKKAFFEAHYKKLAAQKAAAAALLEQANNAAPNNATEEDDKVAIGNENNNSHTSPNYEMDVMEKQDAMVFTLTSEPDSTSNMEANIISESNRVVEKTDPQMEQAAFVAKNSMMAELKNQLEDVENRLKEKSDRLSATPLTMTPTVQIKLHNQLEDVDTLKQKSEKLLRTPPIMTPTVQVQLQNQFKDDDTLEQTEKHSRTPPVMTPSVKQLSTYDQEILASTGKKKPPVSSIKLLKANGTSKFTSTPIKTTAPISSIKDNFATPMSNADKKRATPKSLQMSVNFTPIRELNRFTASVMRKFESTRVGAASSKASKDSLTPLRTPIMDSKGIQKHSALTPVTEKKRNKTPIDSSSSRNHTAGPKWRLLTRENKMRSPIISSPFSLRTEERAARRKKKLEEKFNANVAQKVQLHTKLKEKAETEIRKLRQSFCFQARPLPDFYKERKTSNIETRKVPLTHSESPYEGRKPTPSMAESKTSLPPNRPSLKHNGTKNFKGKSTLTHPLTSNAMMTIGTPENTSPNIQLGNQNDRNYK